jgi:hypothetical protein
MIIIMLSVYAIVVLSGFCYLVHEGRKGFDRTSALSVLMVLFWPVTLGLALALPDRG